MDNNLKDHGVTTENTEMQIPVVEKKRNYIPLVISIVCFIIVTFFVAYLLYTKSHNTNSKDMNAESTELVKPSPSISQSVISKIKITDRDGNVLKSADTLTVNPLGSTVHWQEEPAIYAANLHYADLLYSVSNYPSYTKGKLLADGTYTLTGKLWRGSLQVKDISASDSAVNLGNLEKAGWSNGSNLMNEIVLNDEKLILLQPIEASGPCGEAEGFIAYKDNYFRVVAVGENTTPCLGDGSVSPTPTSYVKKYDIFLSDPVSFNDILLQYKSGKGVTNF